MEEVLEPEELGVWLGWFGMMPSSSLIASESTCPGVKARLYGDWNPGLSPATSVYSDQMRRRSEKEEK